jgi:hypothetical protein
MRQIAVQSSDAGEVRCSSWSRWYQHLVKVTYEDKICHSLIKWEINEKNLNPFPFVNHLQKLLDEYGKRFQHFIAT